MSTVCAAGRQRRGMRAGGAREGRLEKRVHPKMTACQCMMSSSCGAAVRHGGGSFRIFLKSRIRRFRAGCALAPDFDISCRTPDPAAAHEEG